MRWGREARRIGTGIGIVIVIVVVIVIGAGMVGRRRRRRRPVVRPVRAVRFALAHAPEIGYALLGLHLGHHLDEQTIAPAKIGLQLVLSRGPHRGPALPPPPLALPLALGLGLGLGLGLLGLRVRVGHHSNGCAHALAVHEATARARLALRLFRLFRLGYPRCELISRDPGWAVVRVGAARLVVLGEP